jgi:hypothetical protein
MNPIALIDYQVEENRSTKAIQARFRLDLSAKTLASCLALHGIAGVPEDHVEKSAAVHS